MRRTAAFLLFCLIVGTLAGLFVSVRVSVGPNEARGGNGFVGSVAAESACKNCPPTTVVVNGDGSVTVSTTAVPNGGCIGSVSPTKYTCNVYVESASAGVTSFQSDGGPTTIYQSIWGCPCVAYFKVHAGQWKQYSADSAPFSP